MRGIFTRRLFLAAAALPSAVKVSALSSSYSSFSRMSPPFTITRDSKTSTLTLTPRDESSQSGLVVLSHGLGDSPDGLLDLAEHLASSMPHVKFVLPQAPTQPVTMNMGMPMNSWYDITGLDERSNENCRGIIASRDLLRSIMDKEHDDFHLPYNRMVLMGFSQGGALSLFTGMQLPKEKKLAGIAMMSSYLPAQSQFHVTEELKGGNVPILHCHGEADPMVNIAMARKSRQAVVGMGVAPDQYELKTYPGLGHSINMEELSYVGEFLKRVLPPDDACRVTLKDPSDMSVKELKAAIRNAGIMSKAAGFMEKSEFVRLLRDHREGRL